MNAIQMRCHSIVRASQKNKSNPKIKNDLFGFLCILKITKAVFLLVCYFLIALGDRNHDMQKKY